MCLAKGQAHHQLPREMLEADTASAFMGIAEMHDLQHMCGTHMHLLQRIIAWQAWIRKPLQSGHDAMSIEQPGLNALTSWGIVAAGHHTKC